jgi:hydroxymethylpyrimidine/phosphomethylpyrimidine kinase
MNHQPSVPVVLTIAGFDPSSGAGISADLKTFAAHNCYGIAAITALTVQNTQGAKALHIVEPAVLRESIDYILGEGRVQALKIGLLGNQPNAQVVSEVLRGCAARPAVLDPVVRSSNGLALVDTAGLEFLRTRMLSQVTVITPNLEEATALTGQKVETLEEMKVAARRLVEMGARAAVVTGGHLDKAIDVFFDGSKLETFIGDRVKPDNTHGTGCTFSSAIAANLALGRQLRDAVVLAKAYVTEAIRKAYAVGPGRLPLNHLYRMQQTTRLTDHAPAVPEAVH